MEKEPNLDRSAQYLLAEMQTINEKATLYEQIKSNRVNFFLLIVGATGASFSFLSRHPALKGYEIWLAQALSILVLVLGFFILRDMTEYSAAIIFQYRWAGRIRRWFLEDNLSLEKHLPFRAVDDRPKFTESNIFWKSSETIILLINCYLFALIIGLLFYSLSIVLAIVSALIGGIIFWFVQRFYTTSKMKRFENSNYAKRTIYFPSE